MKSLIIILIYSIILRFAACSEDIKNDTVVVNVSVSENPVAPEPTNSSAATSLAPTIVTHNYPITTNICNMSLVTSIENDKAQYKKCKCDGFHGDVDCSHIGLTELPSLISFPKDISIVSFKGNDISDLKEDTFYNAKEVTEMDLSDNQIDFISIKAFRAFKKLVRLDLSHNRVWNLPKDMFLGLGHLRRLDLSYNDLLTVFPGHFSQLLELRELIMKNNPINELEPKHFEHLAKLELLDLDSTLLKVIPDHVFVFTKRLKTLKLANNQLTNVPTEALHVLDHLRYLDLSGNPIEKVHQQAFRGLIGLVKLYLERMPSLTYIENYAFGDMKQLQELHCSYNFKLSDISPYAFVRKSDNTKVPLSQLFLRQNDLKQIPESLLSWDPSVELHVNDNPLHCDCNMDWIVHSNLKNNYQLQARCASPAEYEGVSLNDLKGHELKCGLQLTDIVLIVCGVFTGILILILIVSFLVWRRNYRGYTKPGLYYIPKNRHVNDIDYTGGDDSI